MKVTLESTEQIVNLESRSTGAAVPARIWTGRTETGIPIHAFITRIAVHKDQQQEPFERELQACPHVPLPQELRGVYDLRFIIP